MTADPEAAETYLRLLAETELRNAAPSPGGRHRVRYAALTLAAVGAIDDQVADAIAWDVEAAIALRNHRAANVIQRPVHGMQARGCGIAPQPTPPLALPGLPGQLQATSAGQMFRLTDQDELANLWVLSMVRTPHTTWCAVGALRQAIARNFPHAGHVPRLRALDDRGRGYGVAYSGGGGAHGWLSIHPALPDDVRWIEFYSHLDTPRLRLDVTAGPTAAHVTVDPADPASPGERLLDAIAMGLLAGDPDPVIHSKLGEILAALRGAHALPAGSMAPSRLAAICEQAPLLTGVTGAGPIASLEWDVPPAAELPEPWTSVLTHLVRRHKPTAKPGVAPLAVVLPELDGLRFALTGLGSEADHSLLSVAAQGLPVDDPGHLLGFQWSQWFPWWIRDNAGQWHIATAGGYDPGGLDLATLHLRVVPPILRSVTRLDVVITGRSARITAIVPVGWVSG